MWSCYNFRISAVTHFCYWSVLNKSNNCSLHDAYCVKTSGNFHFSHYEKVTTSVSISVILVYVLLKCKLKVVSLQDTL